MGWTWEYIDEHMTIPRLEAMREYWKHSPPLHQLFAAHIGFKSQDDEPKMSIADMVAAMGG